MSDDDYKIRSTAAECLSYAARVGEPSLSVEMCYADENIWLTQKMMSSLDGAALSTINEHIKQSKKIAAK